VVGSGELTTKAWEQIVPLLPEHGRRASSGKTMAWSRTASSGSSGPARQGAPCHLTTAHGRRTTTVSCGGGATAPEIATWPTRKLKAMR